MESKQSKLDDAKKKEQTYIDKSIQKVLDIIDQLEARVQAIEDWHKKRNEII